MSTRGQDTIRAIPGVTVVPTPVCVRTRGKACTDAETSAPATQPCPQSAD